MIHILRMQFYNLSEPRGMLSIMALQTETCIRTVADITLFRVADVLLAGTVARLALYTFERCVLVPYLKSR